MASYRWPGKTSPSPDAPRGPRGDRPIDQYPKDPVPVPPRPDLKEV